MAAPGLTISDIRLLEDEWALNVTPDELTYAAGAVPFECVFKRGSSVALMKIRVPKSAFTKAEWTLLGDFIKANVSTRHRNFRGAVKIGKKYKTASVEVAMYKSAARNIEQFFVNNEEARRWYTTGLAPRANLEQEKKQ